MARVDFGVMHSEPMAFFITFRCYGTWLQGDERGWARDGDSPSVPARQGHHGLSGSNRSAMAAAPFVMQSPQRQCVERAVREHCTVRGWPLLAINVRTNHVHVVVSANVAPERATQGLKAWSTRALRASELVGRDTPLWSRHGSTRYLWNEAAVEAACTYLVEGQD
jgi:REP element-mobilizing transposase RayT